eukprot:scaffold78393_cov19-Tisochrysis_lutea.AAC.1
MRKSAAACYEWLVPTSAAAVAVAGDDGDDAGGWCQQVPWLLLLLAMLAMAVKDVQMQEEHEHEALMTAESGFQPCVVMLLDNRERFVQRVGSTSLTGAQSRPVHMEQ